MAAVSLEEIFPLLMFPALLLGILSGFPVAFVLSGIGLIFGLIGHFWLDIFFLSDFGFISSKIFGVIENVTLIAVPLFIYMGITLERSQIAEELLETVEQLLHRTKGGLLYGIVLVGALLAASTGIVGATVVTMGALSLPVLLKRRYDSALSTGTICAAGTLGQIIPPSIVLILLADMMNVGVADLFAAAIIPGLLLITLYLSYIFVIIRRRPQLTPSTDIRSGQGVRISQIVRLILPPLLLITLVLGTILCGIASPTEAAACGALGALALATYRKKLSRALLHDVAVRTTHLTAMVFALLFGAQVFGVVFRGMYGDEILIEMLSVLEDYEHLLFWAIMLFFFILGFFLDFLEICFIFIPIITPILTDHLEMPPVWVAILIALNLQTSFLTPPFGFSLFYLRGVAPKEVQTSDIYRGIIPFVILQIVTILLVFSFPALALWLPDAIWGS